MRGIESGQAITLLNWAGVSMNAESLAKMGIKDLRGVRIVDADLSYADLARGRYVRSGLSGSALLLLLI